MHGSRQLQRLWWISNEQWRFLNVLTVLALTALSDNLFQWRTTLWLKNFFEALVDFLWFSTYDSDLWYHKCQYMM